MAVLGQVQPAATGQRPGGGVQRATPYRTTPLTPRPVTPVNSGQTRAPAGQNASMGMVRADRGRAGGMMGGRIPQSRTRSLRPLAMDRSPRGQLPTGGTTAQATVGQRLMPTTSRAYSPSQPQPRGPYSPTPGSSPSAFAGLVARRGQGGNAMWSDAQGRQRYYVDGGSDRIWDYQNQRFAAGHGGPTLRPMPQYNNWNDMVVPSNQPRNIA